MRQLFRELASNFSVTQCFTSCLGNWETSFSHRFSRSCMVRLGTSSLSGHPQVLFPCSSSVSGHLSYNSASDFTCFLTMVAKSMAEGTSLPFLCLRLLHSLLCLSSSPSPGGFRCPPLVWVPPFGLRRPLAAAAILSLSLADRPLTDVEET